MEARGPSADNEGNRIDAQSVPLPIAPVPCRGRRAGLCARAASCVTAAAGVSLMSALDPALRAGVWAQGSDAPEKKEVKVGFIPLTDCASVVIASVMKFDEKYGIKIVPSKEASWAAVRDKLVNGELDAAHVLYGLVYGVQMGIGGPKKDMAVLMTLNNNGQAITLSNQLKDKGATTGATLKALIDKEKREYTFAQTFPTGTHAMWLYYWLAAHGINPITDVKTITVPPPQMVANMRVGNMDGFCVGEPWNNRAIFDKIGFTVETTQAIWKDHPEKVLGTTAEFVQKNPNTSRAMIAAILDASKFIDTMANRKKVAEIIADKSYVNCPVDVIDQRLEGNYDNGIGRRVEGSRLHEVLQRGHGDVSVPVGRHVVPDPAQALGPAEGRPGLPRRRAEGEPDRALQAGRDARQGAGAEGLAAHVEADRRHRVGRQEPEGVRRRIQDQGRGDADGGDDDLRHAHDHCPATRRRARRPRRRRARAGQCPMPPAAPSAGLAGARRRSTTTSRPERSPARRRAAAEAKRELASARRCAASPAPCCRRCSASRCSSPSGRWSRRRRRNCRAPARSGTRRWTCSPIRSTATARTTRASAGTSSPRCSAWASASAWPR